MQRLQVIAHLKNGRIIINDELPLDGIIYHQFWINQMWEERYWNEWNTGENHIVEEKNISENMGKIIKLHTDELLESYNPDTGEIYTHNNKNAGVFLASAWMYDVKKKFTDRIRKRFEELRFEKWGKVEKKIYTTMGSYKNYDMVREVILTESISWAVVWDKQKLEEMLSKIKFIWKEKNIWYGEVERWEVKEKFVKGWRYFPSAFFAPFEIQEIRRVHPPYHLNKNRLKCSKRYF